MPTADVAIAIISICQATTQVFDELRVIKSSNALFTLSVICQG
ncbi:hypothetical protein [Nostoc sp. 'Peltigera malacea cyanobiont' DB3992]|nr:hypothetical protein [Nostoc sp. 'Peltigera malacea cyanobiont' DB3992]